MKVKRRPCWLHLALCAATLLGSVPHLGAAVPAGIAQQAYLKASNMGTNDFLGWSIAVSGDTLVIGAYQEGSSATGVDGNQNNDSAANSGATYVFVRGGTNWIQQAYLKASNT